MEKLIMSNKEIEQIYVFKKLENKEISYRKAALMLNISRRWVIKKFKRFFLEGNLGLVHRNRGKPSKKKWNKREENFVIDLLEGEFKDFGPTFTAEKLNELYDIKISKETLRKAMIKNGKWVARRRKTKYRKQRERRPIFGEMIQLDGSPHKWLEDRADKCTLLVFIDDATSKIVWLEFVKSESTEAVMQASKNYISKYGRPISFYVDYGCVFSVNTNNADRIKTSQFERACKELNINIIHASSPQAKGRVERANKTLQDRLVKELRLKDVSSIEKANKFLQNEYLVKHNIKYSVIANKPGNLHRPILRNQNLNKIFCLKNERILQNDFTINYKKKILQLNKQQKTVIRPKEAITVLETFDSKIFLFTRNIELDFSEIHQSLVKIVLGEKLILIFIKTLKMEVIYELDGELITLLGGVNFSCWFDRPVGVIISLFKIRNNSFFIRTLLYTLNI